VLGSGSGSVESTFDVYLDASKGHMGGIVHCAAFLAPTEPTSVDEIAMFNQVPLYNHADLNLPLRHQFAIMLITNTNHPITHQIQAFVVDVNATQVPLALTPSLHPAMQFNTPNLNPNQRPA